MVEDVGRGLQVTNSFGNVFLLASSWDDPGLTKGVAAFCTEQEGRIISTACILWVMRVILQWLSPLLNSVRLSEQLCFRPSNFNPSHTYFENVPVLNACGPVCKTVLRFLLVMVLCTFPCGLMLFSFASGFVFTFSPSFYITSLAPLHLLASLLIVCVADVWAACISKWPCYSRAGYLQQGDLGSLSLHYSVLHSKLDQKASLH